MYMNVCIVVTPKPLQTEIKSARPTTKKKRQGTDLHRGHEDAKQERTDGYTESGTHEAVAARCVSEETIGGVSAL